MASRSLRFAYVVFVTITLPSVAWGWGESGHTVIAQAAVRLTQARYNKSFYLPFAQKEHMLAHLANVPDIVWRSENVTAEDRALNARTHYISIDQLVDHCVYKDLPRSIESAAKIAAEKKSSLFVEVGTAPWRIQQLYLLLVEDFKRVQASKDKGEQHTAAINAALLHAGLLAHFIGDLANPMHTTADYDGWEAGQGGLHKYFETDLVDAMDLSLPQEIYRHSLKEKPFETKLQSVVKKKSSEFARDLAFALVCNSYNKLAELFALDQKFALKKKSRSTGGINQVSAERKRPEEVRPHFNDFIIARLALAADTLAHLWHHAWQAGGGPDMKTYHSFVYPVQPEFITPDYLP